MYIRSFPREITPAAVDALGTQLLASKAMHEREIALGQRVAEALQPIRHYKKIDIRAVRLVRDTLPDSRAHISYTKNPPGATILRPEYLHFSVGQGYRDQSIFARISVRVDIAAGIASLIATCEACEYSRQQLARVDSQFAHLEEMLDAEEHIRSLVKEIEETRKRVASELLGTEGNYWHDAVREHLPALAGER